MVMHKWLRDRRADYSKIFDSDEGKRVLADMQRECGLHRNNFKESQGNKDALLYLEGMKAMYLFVLSRTNITEAELVEIERGMQDEFSKYSAQSAGIDNIGFREV